MDVVKHLANVSNVVLVCVGLPEIEDFRGNEQYKRRFRIINLPRYNECNQHFIDLLGSIEDRLGLKNESRIWDIDTGIPQWILENSGGALGSLMLLIQEAFKLAISPDKNGIVKDKIDVNVFERVIKERGMFMH